MANLDAPFLFQNTISTLSTPFFSEYEAHIHLPAAHTRIHKHIQHIRTHEQAHSTHTRIHTHSLARTHTLSLTHTLIHTHTHTTYTLQQTHSTLQYTHNTHTTCIHNDRKKVTHPSPTSAYVMSTGEEEERGVPGWNTQQETPSTTRTITQLLTSARAHTHTHTHTSSSREVVSTRAHAHSHTHIHTHTYTYTHNNNHHITQHPHRVPLAPPCCQQTQWRHRVYPRPLLESRQRITHVTFAQARKAHPRKTVSCCAGTYRQQEAAHQQVGLRPVNSFARQRKRYAMMCRPVCVTRTFVSTAHIKRHSCRRTSKHTHTNTQTHARMHTHHFTHTNKHTHINI